MAPSIFQFYYLILSRNLQVFRFTQCQIVFVSFFYPLSSRYRYFIHFGGGFVNVFVCVLVYLRLFPFRLSSWHCYHVNFGGTSVYANVCDCVLFAVARHQHWAAAFP